MRLKTLVRTGIVALALATVAACITVRCVPPPVEAPGNGGAAGIANTSGAAGE